MIVKIIALVFFVSCMCAETSVVLQLDNDLVLFTEEDIERAIKDYVVTCSEEDFKYENNKNQTDNGSEVSFQYRNGTCTILKTIGIVVCSYCGPAFIAVQERYGQVINRKPNKFNNTFSK